MTNPSTTPDNARQLVAAALIHFADDHTNRLDELVDADAVAGDIALARTLAANVTGWTHTTRLRDFLESTTTTETTAAHKHALLALAEED